MELNVDVIVLFFFVDVPDKKWIFDHIVVSTMKLNSLSLGIFPGFFSFGQSLEELRMSGYI